MRDLNDFGRLQYVLDNYDSTERGKGSTAYRDAENKAAKSVVFKKAVNGTYYAVEAVPDTKAHTAYIVSAYMEKNKTGTARAADADAPTSTAKPDTRNIPVGQRISQPGAVVNDPSSTRTQLGPAEGSNTEKLRTIARTLRENARSGAASRTPGGESPGSTQKALRRAF